MMSFEFGANAGKQTSHRQTPTASGPSRDVADFCFMKLGANQKMATTVLSSHPVTNSTAQVSPLISIIELLHRLLESASNLARLAPLGAEVMCAQCTSCDMKSESSHSWPESSVHIDMFGCCE